MMYARLRLLQPLHGRQPGEEFAVRLGVDGSPQNGLWRKRMNDEERWKVGALEIVEMTETAPEGIQIIGENGPEEAPIPPPPAPIVQPQVIVREVKVPAPALPPVDLRPLTARVEVLERRPLAQDWSRAFAAIEERVAGVERAMAHQAAAAQPPQQATLAGTSLRELLNRAADEQDDLAPLLDRIAALEDQLAAMQRPPALPAPRLLSRSEAIATVNKAARERLLDIVSGHVLYELALLAGTSEANAVAASLLKIMADDTARLADAVIRRREGVPGDPAGSEWDQTVRIIAARDHAVSAINDADDGAVSAIMTAALAEIEGV